MRLCDQRHGTPASISSTRIVPAHELTNRMPFPKSEHERFLICGCLEQIWLCVGDSSVKISFVSSRSEMELRIMFIFGVFVFVHLVASQFKCDYRMYGRPIIEDCASAFLALPDAKELRQTARLTLVRKFVEPQLLSPPFSPVINDVGAPMEQIPKFWRYSQCARVGQSL